MLRLEDVHTLYCPIEALKGISLEGVKGEAGESLLHNANVKNAYLGE